VGIADNLENESLFAIRGPNFSTEFEMIENMGDLDPLKLPLLSEILGTTEQETLRMIRRRLSTKFKPPKAVSDSNQTTDETQNTEDTVSFDLDIDPEGMEETAKSFISEYKLNEDQADLILRCAQWFQKGDTSSPICLG